jgi:hypothetical protein
MLHTRWSAEAWSQVRVEFKKALALRSQIRRANQIIERNFPVSKLCQNHRPPTVTNLVEKVSEAPEFIPMVSDGAS